ncbi:hypothetical protein K488DRAFT_90416 [Vararia minispora EC-137]|uniref:Uncharacterized protein n=1 Tax=Vararia minispora EC-137 TaxID=1314806 RepID=A0ACB8Q812_9AGAM|nr:hypothetical protein K488DRAFT_90416 [Vararia minispora EC-137]
MSRKLIDEWVVLTHQITSLLEVRPITGGTSDDALAKGIDVALSLMTSFDAALRAGKNASQKNCASRITKEIFEEILKYAMFLTPIAVTRGSKVTDLRWIKLSHVCRAWRFLTIACEDAWASSVGQLPRATQVFLEQAGSTPVDVNITGDHPLLPSQVLTFSSADEDSVNTILENIDLRRVRTLTVVDGRVRVFPFVDKLDEQSTIASLATLSHLILEGYSWNISQREAILLAGADCCLCAHNLETVKLKNCFMDLVCRALTSLDIEYDALRTLRLHNALCIEMVIDMTADPFDTFNIVNLLDLQYLSLTGPAHSLEDLLTLLVFPCTTVVHLDACIWPASAPDIVHQLARAFGEHLLQDFVTVAVDHDVFFSQQLTHVRMWKEAPLENLACAIRFGLASDQTVPTPLFEVTKIKSASVCSLALSLPSTEYSIEAVPHWIEILDLARVTVDWDLGFLNIEATPVTPFASYSDVNQSAFAARRICQDPVSFNNVYIRVRTIFDRDSARHVTAYAYVRAQQSHSPELQCPRLIFQVLDVFHVYGSTTTSFHIRLRRALVERRLHRPRRERTRESQEEDSLPYYSYLVAHDDLKKASINRLISPDPDFDNNERVPEAHRAGTPDTDLSHTSVDEENFPVFTADLVPAGCRLAPSGQYLTA